MEDLEVPGGSPAVENGQEPEGNNDPGDIQKPEIEEENGPTPPMAEPTDDMDAREDEEVTGDADGDDAERDNDAESELDELDEAQFDNFDPESANINVPEQPVAVDDSNVGLLGVHKRKRVEGEDGERKKKKKEGRREKAKKVRAGGDDEDVFEGGPEVEGSRRKKSSTASKRAPRARTPENEDELSPEERKYSEDHAPLDNMLTIFQAVAVLLIARWTMLSAAISLPAARPAASIWRLRATLSWRICANEWRTPARLTQPHAPRTKSLRTSSSSCLQLSSCSTGTLSGHPLLIPISTFSKLFVSSSSLPIPTLRFPTTRSSVNFLPSLAAST